MWGNWVMPALCSYVNITHELETFDIFENNAIPCMKHDWKMLAALPCVKHTLSTHNICVYVYVMHIYIIVNLGKKGGRAGTTTKHLHAATAAAPEARTRSFFTANTTACYLVGVA